MNAFEQPCALDSTAAHDGNSPPVPGSGEALLRYVLFFWIMYKIYIVWEHAISIVIIPIDGTIIDGIIDGTS